MRQKLQQRKIIISPKCATLINHLRNVRWKSTDKATFARSPDMGHYDAVDALKYFVRHVDTTKNPYPANYGREMRDLYIVNQEKFQGKTQIEAYKKIFNMKKR